MEQTSGMINGCNIGAYSRLSKKCRECMNKEYCQNKRMEAEAYIIPQSNINIAAMNNYGVTAAEAAEAINKAMTAAVGRCAYADITD